MHLPLGGFPLYGYQNFYLLPSKLGYLAQNRPNLAKIYHFWLNIGIFGPFRPMPNQETMQTRCLGGFSVTWVPKILLPPVEIRILGPKTAKFGPKYAFLVNEVPHWFSDMRVCPKICFLGHIQALPPHLVPCWLVVWWLWRAGCILQVRHLSTL